MDQQQTQDASRSSDPYFPAGLHLLILMGLTANGDKNEAASIV